LYDLNHENSIKDNTLVPGKSEEDAVYHVLKFISFKLKKGIPVTDSTTLKSLISHIDGKYAIEGKFEISKKYLELNPILSFKGLMKSTQNF